MLCNLLSPAVGNLHSSETVGLYQYWMETEKFLLGNSINCKPSALHQCRRRPFAGPGKQARYGNEAKWHT